MCICIHIIIANKSTGIHAQPPYSYNCMFLNVIPEWFLLSRWHVTEVQGTGRQGELTQILPKPRDRGTGGQPTLRLKDTKIEYAYSYNLKPIFTIY